MPPISWFSQPSRHHQDLPIRRRLSGAITRAATLCGVLLLMSGQSWSQTGNIQRPHQGTIVAAGFGYQIGGLSTITVKMYDAVSGEVLSDDTFELNVKEEGYRTHPGQDRIFAGGVGLDATDLSNFVLRVYDASTGTFQWEGRLNLSPQDGSGGGLPVSTLIPRRATVTRIHAVDSPLRQPSFLVRALDSTTGGLVWEDEFSTNAAGAGRIERTINRFTTPGGEAAPVSRTFDLTIRMFKADGHGVLWEDQFGQEAPEEEAHETVDDQAHVLPAWPRLGEEQRTPQEI